MWTVLKRELPDLFLLIYIYFDSLIPYYNRDDLWKKKITP